MDLDTQITEYKHKVNKEREERRKAYNLELERQVKPYEDGTKFCCQVWGEGEIRGIIYECDHFYESRWSPKFCTHPAVMHECNPHWIGTSEEGRGKDITYNAPHDISQDWCPLELARKEPS